MTTGPASARCSTSCEKPNPNVAGIELDEFAADQKRQRALIYVTQMVTDAARRVSHTERARITDVPWSKVVGVRNKLVHDRPNVDHEEVWRTATSDLPDLIEALERALSGLSPNEPASSLNECNLGRFDVRVRVLVMHRHGDCVRT